MNDTSETCRQDMQEARDAQWQWGFGKLMVSFSHSLDRPAQDARSVATQMAGMLREIPRTDENSATIDRLLELVEERIYKEIPLAIRTAIGFLITKSDASSPEALIHPKPKQIELSKYFDKKQQAIYPVGKHPHDIIFGPAEGLVVFADSNHLSETIDNLIMNAERFARSTITVTAEDQPDSIHILVADDGTGIHPSVREHLFESGVTTQQPDGERQHGHGLNLAKILMELNGGDIYVKETSEDGTTFVILLPKAPPVSPT